MECDGLGTEPGRLLRNITQYGVIFLPSGLFITYAYYWLSFITEY